MEGSAPDRSALVRLQALCRFGMRPGLERIRSALAALDQPQKGFAAIHLAGTNGKGSTAAMIASCLRQLGLRIGLYTSPHLQRFSERITVDGAEIPGADLARLIDRVIALDRELTFFEVATAVGLAYFAERRIDCGVIETGLGGRLDATNVLLPEVTVLTSIARDHAEVLGEDLPSIAREKVGIVKPAIPVVAAWPEDPAVRMVIERRCDTLGAPLCWIDPEAAERRLEGLDVGLRGAHQRLNAALALAAAERLVRRIGRSASSGRLSAGLARVSWPGRLESVGPFLLDCAHNPAGAERLGEALASAEVAGGSYCLVFGCLDDKPALPLLEPLLPHCGRVILTPIDNPRSADPRRTCAELAGRFPRLPVALVGGAAAAVELAQRDPRPKLVAGSVYLVGEVRGLLLGPDSCDPVPLADPVVRDPPD